MSKWHALAGALLAWSLAACSSGGTFVVVSVEQGSTPVSGVKRIDLDLELGGQSASAAITPTGGVDVILPATKGLDIQHGAGTLAVTAIARDGAGTELARGSMTGTVVRGSTIQIVVRFGESASLDGGVDDGGGDAGSGALSIDRPHQDFGTGVTGSTSAPSSFTITNTGTIATGPLGVALGGSGAGAFSIPSNGCNGMSLPAGGSCMVGVSFAPTTAGAVAATLSVTGTPGGSAQAALTGTGVTPGTLTLTPPSNDFGAVVRGSNSPVTVFTVMNTGGAATGALTSALGGTDLTQFVITADTCMGQTLAGGTSCMVTVRFSPTAAGSKSASLTVIGTPGGTAASSLTGTGLAPGALTIAPLSKDFGSVVVGAQSATQAFIVTNTGGAVTGSLATMLGGANLGEFTVTADTCNGSTLAAAATCTVTVRFDPTAPGAKTATVSVTASPGGSVVANLSANGQGPASLAISPSSFDFLSVPVGSPSAPHTFTVMNSGSQSSGALAVTKSGANAADYALMSDTCTGQIVVGGMSCTMVVVFTPSAAGVRMATLQVVGAPGGTTASTLTGTGQTPAALALSPNPEPFGTAVLGGAPVDKILTVMNSGQAASGPLSLAVSGANSADFTVLAASGGDCVAGATVTGGSSCTVHVRFNPGARGSRTGLLTVTGSPGGSPFSSLTGTGQSPALLSGSVGSNAFPNAEVAHPTASFTWTVTNTGDVASGVPTVSVAGATTDYTDTNTCSAALGPGASCTVTITFNPTTGGLRSATFTVTANPGGSAMIAVTGTGMYRLTVTKVNTGTVTSTDVPVTINCGATCTALYPANTPITLQARPANGSDSYFQSWGGDCASVGTFHDCSLTLSASRNVMANFGNQAANTIFVSSVQYAATLGNALAYDNKCNQLATAAGINNAAGNAYIAWVSDAAASAGTRLGAAARGWTRMDGLAFADDQASFLTSAATTQKIFFPILYDETGTKITGYPQNLVMTGTTPTGAYSAGNNCNEWTSTAGNSWYGWSDAGPRGWTAFVNGGVCSQNNRIICMMKTKSSAVGVTAFAGKKIYLSNNGYIPSAAETPDQRCTTDRPAGVVTAKALISSTTVPASMWVNAANTYVRPDGVVVGTGAELVAGGAAGGGNLHTGVWQSANGNYVSDAFGTFWVGSPEMNQTGTMIETCNNWTSNSSTITMAEGGMEYYSQAGWWYYSWQTCSNTTNRLVCVEQ